MGTNVTGPTDGDGSAIYNPAKIPRREIVERLSSER
jgi:hypothetical protein